jgi:SAM-dependent methyltransferase
MTHLLDMQPQALYTDFLRRCTQLRVDVVAIDRIARATLRYLRAASGHRQSLRPLQQLEQRWYASLAAGAPDYAVYDTPEYLAELWACWVVYSRRYLRALRASQPVRDSLGEVRTIVDLGCGLGYTTAALRELYPDAVVVGTNLDDTLQTKFARTLAQRHAFAQLALEYVGAPVDLVFASEYFEHHAAPIAHLCEVLDQVQPRALLVANTFTARSIGHFDRYDVHGVLVEGLVAARAFTQTLQEAGYQQVDTGFWNGRPAYWTRGAHA